MNIVSTDFLEFSKYILCLNLIGSATNESDDGILSTSTAANSSVGLAVLKLNTA